MLNKLRGQQKLNFILDTTKNESINGSHLRPTQMAALIHRSRLSLDK